ncbi:AAA domain-containing protein [Cochlodiniinecator piscidefendens]|uniref:AAA domain-containing protein n=1 Tax=Cochlodiniinecator piscidefendens TaxID=2715756 RepID=UPI0014072CCE|nr:AAA domain-containing protein [Cochlodiniinecator piscidefendens]
MLDSVSPGWPVDDGNYISAGVGLLKVADKPGGAIAQVIKLYDALLGENTNMPLLENLAGSPSPTKELSLKTEADFINRLGHASDEFPLADQQRQVLSYLSTGKSGDVLAVNGPPGTGKTTMLLSAIADAWVRAALDESTPPVIVAASTNNQAVTNIIDAFGKDFSEGSGPFAGRWLPDIKSYGLYLPAKSKEADAAGQYQTERFFVELESHEYVPRAKGAFMEAGKTAFPNLKSPDVQGVVSFLHKRITEEVAKLSDADKARTWLNSATSNVANLLGDDVESTLQQLERNKQDDAAELVRYKAWEAGWAKHQADESVFLALFSFLPSVARKRMMKGRVALESIGCTLIFSESGSIERIGFDLQNAVRDAHKAAQSSETKYELARSALEDLKQAQREWGRATGKLEAPSASVVDALDVDKFSDCHTRFHLFQLACHYWEGRWLLEMEQDLDKIVKSHKQNEDNKGGWGRKTIEPRWHRRMMLTPCAVATFASLPGKMQFKHGSAGGFNWDYFYNFIDLLIVDEAGQVLPEVAAASFALAKRALVIGDTQQIEPISSVTKAVDIGNLQGADFLQETFADEDLTALSATGMRSVGGSVMRLAQQACAYEPYPELERGLYLFEHRRCYDEIINFSNKLCYKGSLKPMRGSAPEGHILPSMGYLHIDGMSRSYGGSHANATEAATIADWLAENRQRLESQYSQKLGNIVGIITPFGRQVQEIKRACADRGIDAKMVIGTVDSLQGAERPVILFSPVYSKHADGKFIDMSPSRLNVAVSRAKDSFLVFGDMDVFSSAGKGTPRSVLAECLFSQGNGALEFATQPRADLEKRSHPLSTLRDAEEHDRFLKDALSTAHKITIVSPWIIASTMRRSGLLNAFQSAVARGARIDVFADPLLNQLKYSDGLTQLEAAKSALQDVGVQVHEVRQLHSKIVIVDANRLCIGSYNWLSADRKGQYARHETSILYKGSHLQDEIDVIKQSLGVREAR